MSDDRARREAIEARNEGEALNDQVEKTFRESRDRLPATDVEAAEQALGLTRGRPTAGGDVSAAHRPEGDRRLAEGVARRGRAARPRPRAPRAPVAACAQGQAADVVDAEVVQ